MRQTRAQKREELLKAAQAVIEEYLDWEEQAEKPNLREIEDVVLRLRQRLGRQMAKVAIADQETRQPSEPPGCPTCGEAMRYKGLKTIEVQSRLGGVGVERGYYYCARCQSGLFPPRRPA